MYLLISVIISSGQIIIFSDIDKLTATKWPWTKDNNLIKIFKDRLN